MITMMLYIIIYLFRLKYDYNDVIYIFIYLFRLKYDYNDVMHYYLFISIEIWLQSCYTLLFIYFN